MRIRLDFGTWQLGATLRDTAPAHRFAAALPATVELTAWGEEAYGPLGATLGSEAPVPTIPAGGLAWSDTGDLFCLFYGQTPAWPVDHLGDMDVGWERLRTEPPARVTVTMIDE